MNKIYAFILSIFLSLQLFSQSFEKTFSPGNATSILQKDDSSFVVSIFQLNHGLFEISPDGDSILYENFSNLAFEKIIKSFDNTFLATGTTIGLGGGTCLVRLDNSLDTIWMKIYLPGSSSRGMEVVELPDSSIMLSISEYGGMSTYNCTLLHLDKDGNILWQTNPSFSNSMINNIDVKDSLVYQAVNIDTDVLGLNCYNIHNGDTVWQKQYSSFTLNGMDFKYYSRSIVIADSGLYVVGSVSRDSAGVISTMQMFFRTDLNGDSVLLNIYSPGNFIRIISTSPVNYYCTGTSTNDSIVLMALDNMGIPVWSRNFRAYDKSYTSDLISTSDAGFAFCGQAIDTSGNLYYTYIVRTDSAGNVVIINTIPEVSKSVVDYIYNRGEHQLKIYFEEFGKELMSAEIYSISGKLLMEKKLEDQTSVLDLNSFSPGEYIVVLRNNRANISQHKLLIY